jgi:hypothetical protein
MSVAEPFQTAAARDRDDRASATPPIYAPRDEDELVVVLKLLQAPYRYATGSGSD